ncbi:histidinol-phosphate transaminase [Buchnera aphidicola]|uniref:Histidinol-phosphate aminotransferase n=2 Tax=Buchnera aphidicola subsp. Melaphis rhois TaxID=118103 RepID=HIS8_BUCMH|nr:histidinol-phosphate transaminase [Buchnera aphidicola]Q84I52.1 RecName: Full=Histidinol-phosphate aminotransferase; AltName: Full=Imidazole acetol-phosphate transaminase [Buchnera aphidicola (Melaphis rhois)]AAO33046.1 histidinolphosphate aminotransferase [Buchnera aphidicola]QCI23134.1 histidinol-phosphate transaminase [Buchnera aphidicola (Melaphis rhois)]
MNIKKLVRKDIRELIPYQSARKIGGKGDIWLNANEFPEFNNIKLNNIILNRYPECQPEQLTSCYSSYIGINKSNILITRGIDEAIELLIKTFCNPQNEKIIFCPPTYDMYNISAKIIGIKSYEVPLLNFSWQLDINNIAKYISDAKLIYICNPNNPTGNLINYQDIITLLNITLGKTLVIVDEAYIEFSPIHSLTNLIDTYPNLVILRTLSKAFALAGLRCGFILTNVNIVKFLLKVINPYPIPIPTTSIAVQFLSKNNINEMRNRIFDLTLNRFWLVNKLKSMNNCVEHVFNSFANYILVRFYNSRKVFDILSKKGIIVRDQSNKLHLSRCLRISIGTSKECLEVVRVIQKINSLCVY